MSSRWLRVVGCAALALACDAMPPAPELRAVAPARGFTDRRVRLSLLGDGFLPSYQLDLESGRRIGETSGFAGRLGDGTFWVPLTDFGWKSAGELSAWLEPAPGLAPGMYQIELTDPRGRRSVLPRAFETLGVDAQPPSLAIIEPAAATPVAPNMQLPLRLEASDLAPGVLFDVHWEARAGGTKIAEGRCPLDPAPDRVICRASLRVPETLLPGDVLELAATAVDDAPSPRGNQANRALTFTLRARPTVSSLAPTKGGVSGGTDLVIRGSGFLPGTRAFLDDRPLWPDGGVVVSENVISGRAPALPEALVNVVTQAILTVRTPIGGLTLAQPFTYEPPPLIEAILPNIGDPDGGTPVFVRGRRFTADTKIYVGPTLVSAVPLNEQAWVGLEEIRGTTPPGRGRTSVWALDRALGWTRLVDGWHWGDP